MEVSLSLTNTNEALTPVYTVYKENERNIYKFWHVDFPQNLRALLKLWLLKQPTDSLKLFPSEGHTTQTGE